MEAAERDITDKELEIQYINGFPFPETGKGILFKKEYIQSALEFVPRDDDIIISTYPKTGTNWIKYLVWEILNEGAPLPSIQDLHFLLAPILEATEASVVQNLSSPRLVQCHLPYHLVRRNSSAKYIYMIRNPKDTLVSYFHFVQMVGAKKDPFNDFFQRFLEGKVWFGDYFDHVRSWYDHRDDPNILILSYEQMKADPRKELFKIATFLGQKYLAMLKEDEELTATILERTSFGYMKKNLEISDSLNARKDIQDTQDSKEQSEEIESESNFFRKGIVGDWKRHFSPDQNERFERVISERFRGSDISKFWDV